jgi:hypothetical protein
VNNGTVYAIRQDTLLSDKMRVNSPYQKRKVGVLSVEADFFRHRKRQHGVHGWVGARIDSGKFSTTVSAESNMRPVTVLTTHKS